MNTAFRVVVKVAPYGVSKEVIEQKVITITEKYVTFDEMGTKVRIPRSQVFFSAEDALREAESLGNEMIAKLVGWVAKLKEPAVVRESPSLRYSRDDQGS